ncbi:MULTISPECIES: hypothetical protein [unclassified Tolypothrix]|uniref:hypothetical protein n=1 Tax=unclassified Tolypothrix TaxID=2649714 RepID=UPI000B607553|nr:MULTISPECIES: hypothetical protein [unclassified Tolypothrix]MBE9083228.1 hypothetical protein [Tolypothrix sp. LEGE 11397]UYD23922.1 hypothetical protein HGR01_20695 [Tolypothrix sp. PCC 7712]UYD33852.1 hypothetical protein HG267_34055 [Tolypothrix sp. PCC 7601]BAY89652.1 hypothetical protein NIES3275_16550 [Microchaete diplosiphon NIES-3275]
MGGRTSSSWPTGSSWRSGETKTIRVPIVLEQPIMDYARTVDLGVDPVEQLITEFLKIKRRQYSRPINHESEMTAGVRWEIFNEFRRFLECDRISKKKSAS